MKNLIDFLPVITTIGAQERMIKESYKSGEKCGHEQGIKDGLELKIQKSSEVTESEYKDFILYLINNGFVLSYSNSYVGDKFSCGLILRKEPMAIPGIRTFDVHYMPDRPFKFIKVTMRLKREQFREGKWYCTIKGELKICNSDYVCFYSTTYLNAVKALDASEIYELRFDTE